MAVQGKLSAVEVAAAVGRPIIIRSRGNTEEKALPRGKVGELTVRPGITCFRALR